MKPHASIWTTILLVASLSILGTQGYDDDDDNYYTRYSSDDDNTLLIWVIVVVVVIIIKIAVVTWFVLRRRRLRRAMVSVPNPCPARLPGQSALYPSAPVSQVPYGTPQAAYGYPGYPPQVYNPGVQPPYAPNPSQTPAAGPILPGYQDNAPPPYERVATNTNESKTGGYQKL